MGEMALVIWWLLSSRKPKPLSSIPPPDRSVDLYRTLGEICQNRPLLHRFDPVRCPLRRGRQDRQRRENCQAFVENTKVIFEHSTPLTSQIARRKLAGFKARLGILEIEGKNKKGRLKGGLFCFPEEEESHEHQTRTQSATR
jgi:hypothetical protein